MLETPWADDAERVFRMAFHGAPTGMVIASLAPGDEGRYLMVNDAFARMLGLPVEELVGLSCGDLIHPDDMLVDCEQFAQMTAGVRSRYQREKRMRCADGSWLWVRMAASVVERDGEPAYVIVHAEDVTARRAVEAELARRALYDPLTGLANRALLLDHLEMAVLDLGRDRDALAVFYLDLDHFKDINDTLGHAAGDEVLRQMGARLSAEVRPPDTAARLAGDEFVVAARAADDVEAVRTAKRLHVALSAPVLVGNRELVVRSSVGVTTTTSLRARPEDLLREADAAMYQAKRQCRRPWALYDETLHGLALERLAIEDRLRDALESDRLVLHYQPIVDLSSGRMSSAEALLRLRDAQGTLVLPEDFIDVAEDSDLIVPIGDWVLREACRQLAVWQAYRPDVDVAVNVSARQVSQLVVREQALTAASAAGVDPSRLQLEITERVLVDAGADVVAELDQVTAAGCGLAIDDFGTGYSSLSHLGRFPVGSVKIDRSFVSGLGVRSGDSAIVAAVTSLGRALGLTVVGEGVESREQLLALRRIGCHRAQGFHLGRPLPGPELTEMIKSGR
ncbi:MAG: Diguanylate phosphodiesterase [Actinomycetota bacterium]|nr:Diguanylate phosphodiesterase [Actinomycetota bacterium]